MATPPESPRNIDNKEIVKVPKINNLCYFEHLRKIFSCFYIVSISKGSLRVWCLVENSPFQENPKKKIKFGKKLFRTLELQEYNSFCSVKIYKYIYSGLHSVGSGTNSEWAENRSLAWNGSCELLRWRHTVSTVRLICGVSLDLTS